MNNEKKYSYNLEKVNQKFFTCDNIDDYLYVPDNTDQILEQCKTYSQVEYPIALNKVKERDENFWIAEHPDLPGCKTHGKTKQEALLNLEDAKQNWIFAKLCASEEIPAPNSQKEYEECSGRILLRLPKEMHYKLIQKARQDETSLNQELVALLAYALGENTKSNLLDKLLNSLSSLNDVLLRQREPKYYLSDNIESQYLANSGVVSKRPKNISERKE